MSDTLWVAGKTTHEGPEGIVWEFQGVFPSEAEAVKAVNGHPSMFVGPAKLGEMWPVEKMGAWPEAYYPATREAEVK